MEADMKSTFRKLFALAVITAGLVSASGCVSVHHGYRYPYNDRYRHDRDRHDNDRDRHERDYNRDWR